MPTFINPRVATVEPRGGAGRAVAAVVVAGVAGFLAVKVLASPAFAVAIDVAVGVVAALCAALIAVVVRYVLRDRGTLWRPARPVTAAVPVAALPARVPLAIEAPKRVLTGVVIDAAERVTVGD